MTQPVAIALFATELPADTGAAPEWLHLLPPSGTPFAATDGSGRGPWIYHDAEALIAASLAAPGPRLFIDVNHSTPQNEQGAAVPGAIGDIVELQARETGIWGRVQWTTRGAQLMGDRAYRAVSPVFLAGEDGQILSIWHVSMTNNPGLRGSLETLTAEDAMQYGKIAKALGLAEDATEDMILDAIRKMATGGGDAVAMNAIAQALDVQPGAPLAEVVLTARALKDRAAEAPKVEALQAQLVTLQAEGWVKDQINAGRAITDTLRADVVALYAQDPARAKRFVEALPTLAETHTGDTPPAGGATVETLTSEAASVFDQLGLTDDQRAAAAAQLNQEG